MPATRYTIPPFTTPVRNDRRFLHCVACGTIKKERSYALCSECYRVNGSLDRGFFTCFARHAVRETPEYSYRSHPEFEKASRIYARRRKREKVLAEFDARIPAFRYRPSSTDRRGLYAEDPYDGLGSHDLSDLIDWQMHGVELPQPERSTHQELTDAEIAEWDAKVDAWARKRGVNLAAEPTPEDGETEAHGPDG